MLVTILLFSIVLIACKNSDSSAEDPEPKKELAYPEEEKIAMSFIGMNSKPAGPMGVMSGGQLINLYKDKTIEITTGFYATMIGSQIYTYKGTYTLEGDVLNVTYKYSFNGHMGSGGGEEKEASFETTITDNHFRAQIFLGATFPDDGTDKDQKGYTYYKIDNTSVKGCEYAYISTLKTDKHNAYLLRFNKDKTLDLMSNIDNKLSKENGTYVVNSYDDVDKTDELILKFNNIETKIPFNNTTAFRFTFKGIESSWINIVSEEKK